MAFFNDLGKKLSSAGQATMQKTKEMADIAKLNASIYEEEKKIKTNYSEIGKLYVSLHSEDCEENFASMIAAIRASEEAIVDLKKQIQDVKGVKRCEKCGAEVAVNAAFCNSCGAEMPKDTTETVIDSEVAEETEAVPEQTNAETVSTIPEQTNAEPVSVIPEQVNSDSVE